MTSVEKSPENLPTIKPSGNINFSGGMMNCEPRKIESPFRK
jgi:hypothetical protein